MEERYKSIHTGRKIDEAITKLLTGAFAGEGNPDAITITNGGEMVLSQALKEEVGDGPYVLDVSESSDMVLDQALKEIVGEGPYTFKLSQSEDTDDKNISVTISKGGEMILDSSLKNVVGEGPYTLKLSKSSDDESNGGVKSFNGRTGIVTPLSGDYTASQVPISAISGISAGNVQGALSELKTSVSNGKSAIASAITDKGISTSPTADFSTMAENIRGITTGIDTSDANAAAGDISSTKTAYVKGEKVTGTLQSTTVPEPTITYETSGKVKASVTVPAGRLYDDTTKTGVITLPFQSGGIYTPSTSNVEVIPAGTWAQGSHYIKGDANLTPSNIKSGVSIFDVQGSYSATIPNRFNIASGASNTSVTASSIVVAGDADDPIPPDLLSRPFMIMAASTTKYIFSETHDPILCGFVIYPFFNMATVETQGYPSYACYVDYYNSTTISSTSMYTLVHFKLNVSSNKLTITLVESSEFTLKNKYVTWQDVRIHYV